MMSSVHSASRFFVSTMLLGALAGTALIAVLEFSTPRSRASLTYLVYVTLVVGAGIVLRRAGSRVRRYTLGLTTFMLASLVFYIYLATFVNPNALRMPMWEHAWRLGFMLGVGALATAIPLALGALIGGSGGRPDASSTQRSEHRVKQTGSGTEGYFSNLKITAR